MMLCANILRPSDSRLVRGLLSWWSILSVVASVGVGVGRRRWCACVKVLALVAVSASAGGESSARLRLLISCEEFHVMAS